MSAHVALRCNDNMIV